MELPSIERRTVLRSAFAGLAGAVVAAGTSACTTGEPNTMPAQDTAESTATQSSPAPRASGGRVLLAYFSRAGENYYYGGRTELDVGNTEVLAGMVSSLIACDVHRIVAADPYPDSYDAAVARNVREQDADARPAITSPLPSIDQYGTVLLASGVWNVRAPMIMSTFAESYDFNGKTIYPVTTHAMSGLGTTGRDYAASCPGATIGEGLAVRGEEVREVGPALEAWLRRAMLL
ncbi:flavodoxin [Pseudarthrobacter sulfonivorans]|uniref:flavodoxin n=1 Tax=Pseudarthrobacter sulfonivorans TaxID=121292 RepID=UPI002863F30D|nr:flavodoxin [Pseudarthrobacter sulfonivorans]MDR6414607.1 flavodoxin [Pseudarthrobacter sulfonivorans]